MTNLRHFDFNALFIGTLDDLTLLTTITLILLLTLLMTDRMHVRASLLGLLRISPILPSLEKPTLQFVLPISTRRFRSDVIFFLALSTICRSFLGVQR